MLASKSGRCSAETWPEILSTRSQGPGCHVHREPLSPGRVSFTCRARCTTKERSVTSCRSPVVHSFCLSSTMSGRILSVFASSALSSLLTSAATKGTRRAPPRPTVCTLEPAAKVESVKAKGNRRTSAERKICIRCESTCWRYSIQDKKFLISANRFECIRHARIEEEWFVYLSGALVVGLEQALRMVHYLQHSLFATCFLDDVEKLCAGCVIALSKELR